MGFEIERKFLVKALPSDLERFDFHLITQGYLCRQPAVRVRREDERFYMTYKGIKKPGELKQEEYNLDLTEAAYEHLLKKADGCVIKKRRYLIPLNDDAFDDDKLSQGKALKIELDVFEGDFDGLVIAEVEFPDEETARAYRPADWFLSEVTGDFHYSNAWLSENGPNLAFLS